MSAAEIVTEGAGWHEQPGDRAEVDVSYAATGVDRAAAVAELGRRVAATGPALAHPGVTVRHRRLWVSDEWRGDQVVGARASEEVALVVVDVAVLADVLAALVATEPADLRGLRWSLLDPSAALHEAQRRAVADARQRAEGYADALGGRLGELRRLTDVAEHGGGPVELRMAAHAEGVAADVRELGLEPEPVRVTARCSIVWTLVL